MVSEIDIMLEKIEELCSKLSGNINHENQVGICYDLEESLEEFVKIRVRHRKLFISDKERFSLS